MQKVFTIIFIFLFLTSFLPLRALYLIKENSKLLNEIVLDTITEDAVNLSDFGRDYLIKNIKKCSQGAATGVFSNQLHFRKLDGESELITSEADKIQKKCLRNYVLNAPTSQEAITRNAKLAQYALAPYTTDEMSLIFSDAVSDNYANTADALNAEDKQSEKLL